MPRLSVPTTSALRSTQVIPSSHPAVHKTLNRLSRSSLLSLVLDWLDERNQENISPFLANSEGDEGDDEDLYPAAQSLPELREIYTELQARKGSKRDVVDRIVEGDWREGITLFQLAMADMQYLYDHPLSQKWTALKIVRLSEDSTTPTHAPSKPVSMPRFHPSTFLRNIQREALPDVKAHYNLNRHSTLPITILRIFVAESPYNTSAALMHTQTQNQAAAFDSSKVFYIAFPDASPYVYVSITTSPGQTQATETRSLRKLLLDGIPKAFSKPRARYKLESTNLSAKNLEALVERRGGNGTNAAQGGWGIYAEEKKGGRENPLNTQLLTPETEAESAEEVIEKRGLKRAVKEDERVVKRRKLVAQGRFGNSGKADDGKGIEMLDVRIEDSFPSSQSSPLPQTTAPLSPDSPLTVAKQKKRGRSAIAPDPASAEEDEVEETDGWRPDIRFTFRGTHVHAGIRELVEAGIIDGEKMPGWMSGEEGVSVGVVRNGRIRGAKGSGGL